MTSEADDLLQMALCLPVRDRAGVAAVLLSSLDSELDADPQSVEDAWVAEFEERARRVVSGQSTGTQWEEVRDGLAARLSPG